MVIAYYTVDMQRASTQRVQVANNTVSLADEKHREVERHQRARNDRLRAAKRGLQTAGEFVWGNKRQFSLRWRL